MVEQSRIFHMKDLQDKLNSKDSMYDFMARLDHYLPNYKSPICTILFMQ